MFTEEMLLAGAKAMFESELTMADWHNPHWREFKAHCFKCARLVLAAALEQPPATCATAAK